MQRGVLQEWLNLEGREFDHLMDVVGFEVQGDVVRIPLNKENAAKSSVLRENVKFDRRSALVGGRVALTRRQSFRGSSGGRTSSPLEGHVGASSKRRNDTAPFPFPA